MAEIVTASILANSEVITATLTSGSEQMTATINVAARGPMGPVGSGAWGTITGTLSNQTDLQTALNLKANLASPTFTGVVTAPRITGRCDGIEVLCKAGLAINAGQVVYVTGASGTNIVIGLARANAESTSSKTLGISESTLAHNNTGYVITEGLMTVSISAPTANEGDPIWLSPTTAGSMVFGLANKPSAPNHIVYLGVVTRKTGDTVVEIYVKVQNGAELDELSDVAITSAVAGQALMRGATLWENRSLVIADITDATTYVPFLAAASNTFTGLASFTSTTRPTAPNVTGTPAATSLITRNDGDARFGATGLAGTSAISITSQITPQTIRSATLAVGLYYIRMVFLLSGTANTGTRHGYAFSGAATPRFLRTRSSSVPYSQEINLSFNVGLAEASTSAVIEGIINVTGAGTFSMQAAQNTSHPDVLSVTAANHMLITPCPNGSIS